MRIGILTSGGDCPGINATIRGVCKTAINHYGMEVIGIHSGFQGLLTKDIESFTDKSLSGLLNQGGTMLGTSREKPFKKRRRRLGCRQAGTDSSEYSGNGTGLCRLHRRKRNAENCR